MSHKTRKPSKGNAYTYRTGDGYLTVVSAGAHGTVQLDIEGKPCPWTAGDRVAVCVDDDRIRLRAMTSCYGEERDQITRVTDAGRGRKVSIPRNAIAAIGVQPNGELRVYDRVDEEGVTVVPRLDDPFVDGNTP